MQEDAEPRVHLAAVGDGAGVGASVDGDRVGTDAVQHVGRWAGREVLTGGDVAIQVAALGARLVLHCKVQQRRQGTAGVRALQAL